MSPLIVNLRRVRRRLTLLAWLDALAWGLVMASGAACVWLVATRLFPVLGDAMPVFAGALALALAGASVLAFVRRPGLKQAALAADSRLELRERFTSSLEMAEVEDRYEGRTAEVIQALHEDARAHVNHLKVSRDFPVRLRPVHRWVLVPLLLFGLGYVALPEFDVLGQRARELEAKTKQDALQLKAKRLTDAAKRLRPPEKPEAGENKGVSRDLESLAAQLGRQEISEKQALARVTKLTERLEKQRAALEKKKPTPKLADAVRQMSVAKASARDLAQGRPAEAAQKLRDLQKKLREGNLSDKEKAALAQDLQALAKEMGGMGLSADAAEALAKAGGKLDAAAMDKLMEAMELSMEEMASVMEQMAKLDAAMLELGEWKQEMMGPSEFCRTCGKRLKPCKKGGKCKGCGEGHCCSGTCASCGSAAGAGQGLGLLGAGRGQGNVVGELPDAEVSMRPTMLPGPMTEGKLLADIMQRTAPEVGAESRVEFAPAVVIQVQQETEQALTQEEIPRGAKEFVRQYFGSLEGSEASP